MNNDEKALQAATEIMELVSKYALASQLKAKIQLVIIKVLEDNMDNSEQRIDAMLADIEQSYDPECLAMASVEEYVRDAVVQLYNKGYCKEQYWMKKAMGDKQ